MKTFNSIYLIGNEIPVVENTPEIRRKICETIQLYNCKKIYNIKTCNCQTFAQSIFEVLGFKSEFSKLEGPVGNYIRYIINNPKTESFACLVDKNLKIMKQNGNPLTWKTHQQLDEWQNEESNAEDFY